MTFHTKLFLVFLAFCGLTGGLMVHKHMKDVDQAKTDAAHCMVACFTFGEVVRDEILKIPAYEHESTEKWNTFTFTHCANNCGVAIK